MALWVGGGKGKIWEHLEESPSDAPETPEQPSPGSTVSGEGPQGLVPTVSTGLVNYFLQTLHPS